MTALQSRTFVGRCTLIGAGSMAIVTSLAVLVYRHPAVSPPRFRHPPKVRRPLIVRVPVRYPIVPRARRSARPRYLEPWATIRGHHRVLWCGAKDRLLLDASERIRYFDVPARLPVNGPDLHPRDNAFGVLSPDGRRLIQFGTYSVLCWNARSGRKLYSVPADLSYASFTTALSPNGRLIATGGHKAPLTIRHAANGRIIRILGEDLDSYFGWPFCVGFSPDGRYVVADYRTYVFRWDTRNWRREELIGWDENSPLCSRGQIVTMDFSPDGRTLSVGTQDDTLRVWDLHTRKIVQVLPGSDHEGFMSTSFNPVGRFRVTGNADGKLRVWDLAGKLEETDPAFGGDVDSIAFSADGSYLAAGSEAASMLKVWRVLKH